MMIARWTIKSLLRDPMGLLGSAAAIAAALVLVMLFEAVWLGESRQIVAYVSRTDADVWVMQKGVSNMHMASSLVPTWKEDSVGRVEGVADVTPILYLNSIVRVGNRDWFAYVVGLETGAPRGGPWAMAQGDGELRPGQAIVPDLMASLSAQGLGGTARIADKTLAITGLSSGTFSMGNPVLFVHASDLDDVLSASGYVSYLLVKARPGVRPEALAAAIRERVDKVSVMSRDAFIRSDYQMAVMMGVELIGLFTAIGASLAVLLITFTLYTHTLRRRRELAVLKALGFRRRHIYASVVIEALVLSALGFALAYLLAQGAIALTALLAPQITMLLTGAILAKVGLMGAAVALAATLVPAHQVARIDPQTVFQS
jgi:cell division protein FtsX